MSNEILNIKDLTLEIGETKILKGVSFTVNKGEIISIIGSSGSGKTSLIRCLNLLNYPTSGSIHYKRENILDAKYNINSLRTNIGMVFQNFNLFNQMTVLENMILAPMKVLKMKKQDAITKATEKLKMVNMEKFIKRPVEVLSGGQKQRVAIARALMMDPEVLLFDEPTSALDPEMVDEVLNVIFNLKDTGITLIIVSHEMAFVKRIASRIIFMQDGKILYDDTKDNLINNMPQEIENFLIKKEN